jgi:hypothetical protein
MGSDGERAQSELVVGSLTKADHNIPLFILNGNTNDEPKRVFAPFWARSLFLLNGRGRRIRVGLDPHP